jgi:hypothetical protein
MAAAGTIAENRKTELDKKTLGESRGFFSRADLISH